MEPMVTSPLSIVRSPAGTSRFLPHYIPRAVRFGGVSTDRLNMGVLPTLANLLRVTALVLIRQSAAQWASGGYILAHYETATGNGWGIRNFASGQIRTPFEMRTAGGVLTTPTGVYTADAWWWVGFRGDATNSAAGIHNIVTGRLGGLISQAPISTGTPTSGTPIDDSAVSLAIGTVSDNNIPFAGDIALALVFPEFLSLDAINAVTRRPWAYRDRASLFVMPGLHFNSGRAIDHSRSRAVGVFTGAVAAPGLVLPGTRPHRSRYSQPAGTTLGTALTGTSNLSLTLGRSYRPAVTTVTGTALLTPVLRPVYRAATTVVGTSLLTPGLRLNLRMGLSSVGTASFRPVLRYGVPTTRVLRAMVDMVPPPVAGVDMAAHRAAIDMNNDG